MSSATRNEPNPRLVLSEETFGGLVASDASDFMKFSYDVLGQTFTYRGLMSNFEADQSSGYRELVTILDTFKADPDLFKRDKVSIYYWLTDSTCAAIWLMKGSRVRLVQSLLRELFRILSSISAKIVPIWVPRTTEAIVLADIGSKFKDTDDWGINGEAFTTLQSLAGRKFTADCFAYSTNAKCKKILLSCRKPTSQWNQCLSTHMDP